MQTPLQVDFQGMKASPSVREKIVRHVSDLEDRFGRITACRVVLKAPGKHHRVSLYEFNVHLVLPNGRQVDVTDTPAADERHTNIDFALNDVFKRTRRRLQDQVRRMQSQVKTPQRQPAGKVVRLEDEFGILEASDGHEVYFHRHSVLNDSFARLKIGSRVAYVEEAGAKGPQASTVRLQGKHSMRPGPNAKT